MPVHQPLILPHLKSRADALRVHPMRAVYRCLVVVMLDMAGQVDVVAVIDEVHAVEGHRLIKTMDHARPL